MKSKGYLIYLRKQRINNISVVIAQIFILVFFIFLWQWLSDNGYINTFITSSPKRVFYTLISLFKENNLWRHIFITLYETIISFLLATFLGIIIAIILWYQPFLSKVIDPYLTVFNSLPKVALGPILIIWVGSNMKSIIIMALLVSLVITIVDVYNGFRNTDNNRIKLMRSIKVTKFQMLYYLILPSNYKTIISCLKINISMSLIGVIMGELLVSKNGIGYLIMYGSQVFNLDLVMTGIFILMIVSYIMYFIVNYLEKVLIKKQL